MAAASLIAPLAISGSRKSDGTANASGLVYAYLPGTLTTAQLYSDADATAVATQPLTLDTGGRINRSTYPNGVFCAVPIRLLVQDAAGATVSDSAFTPATAGNVSVSNAGFTGTNMDEVLTEIAASVGGTDGLFKAAAGATARTVQSKLLEGGVSPEDFGAVGNGVAVDTTPLQAAFNFVAAAGSGVVRLTGTYKTDQAIVLSNTDGVSVIGDGLRATAIVCTNATANAFTFNNCDSLHLEGFDIQHSGTSTGRAISLTDCLSPTLVEVGTDAVLGDGDFRYGVYADGCSGLALERCGIYAIQADAAARALFADDCPGVKALFSVFSTISGYAAEFDGTTYMWAIHCQFLVTVRYAVGLTGTGFKFLGGTMTTQSIATATDPDIRMFATNIDGYTVNVLSGATATPDRAKGNFIRIRATTTGAAITIAAPTPTPLTTARGLTMVLDIFNNAGGAMSHAYTMDAVYHLATAPNQTDLNHNVYLLAWDPDSSVWRQISLSVTT